MANLDLLTLVFVLTTVIGTTSSQGVGTSGRVGTSFIGGSSGVGWTGWYDFDNPSGAGDYELIKDHPTLQNWRPCGRRLITWIHAKVRGQPDWSGIQTQDDLIVGPNYGLYCKNAANYGRCRDYSVRYFGSFTSTWKDYDNPGYVDDERINNHRNVPNRIQYIRIGDNNLKPTYRVDQKIRLGPTWGFECRNREQLYGDRCRDYTVRYYCGRFPNNGGPRY